MSITTPNSSADNGTSSSAFRVKYSEYVADITGSPKTTRKLAATGIGHHINPLQNPYPNQQKQPTQQSGGMPQYGGGSEKCARCLKPVYLAEKKVGAGKSFHNTCFSCFTCKRKLDAAALSEHKGEIYCKSCYTRQFGAHGLISGVTMSTEIPVTRDQRHSHRASFSSDLDETVVAEQQIRPRTKSSENVLRDRHSATKNNEFVQIYPRVNDVSPEKTSPNRRNNGVNAVVNEKYRRSTSPLGFERVSESKTNDNHERSNRETQRSRSPSITSIDSYRRQGSHDRPTDVIDDYSRMNLNEYDRNKMHRQNSTGNTMNAIASENPLTSRTFYHSSPTPSSPNNYDREQYHSGGSSPSVTVNRNPSPSPASGYISSSSTTRTPSNTYSVGALRDATAPYITQHENVNTRTPSNFNNRDSSSPPRNDQTSYGLNDFVRRTNVAENISSSGGNQFSTVGALINNPRQQYSDFDD